MAFDISNWMDLVQGSKLLSELSIPGTHGSAACDPVTTDLILKRRLTTQSTSILEQLMAGIRFLDIRARYKGDKFELSHETTYLGLDFNEAVDVCQTFLHDHPEETIIMSLKEESGATDNTENLTFQGRFEDYVKGYPDGLWYTGDTIPRLGDVRGKIVLFRRFSIATTEPATVLGINASNFKDNDTFTITLPSGVLNQEGAGGLPRLRIQDGFLQLSPSEFAGKYTNVENLLTEAVAPGHTDVLYVNFTSGAGVVVGLDPEDVAATINPQVLAYFENEQHRQGRFGIIVMDFETTPLNTLIAHTNVPLNGGYWIVDENAAVKALGSAATFNAAGRAATEAIAMAATPSRLGYYLLTLAGKVYAYGDARNAGEGVPAGSEAVSIAVSSSTAKGPGYWILTKNGEVRAYNANHYGQIESSAKLEAVSIVATADRRGYWILASNGRVHHFGSAARFDDRRNTDQVSVAMTATPDGGGYWILARNGAVHEFGNAVHHGQGLASGTARGIAATPDGTGYWILTTEGNIYAFGSAGYLGRSRHAEAVGIAAS